jgi:hypothetical protein
MSRQTHISLVVAAIIGISSIALFSSDALAYRGGARVGVYHGGMYHGGVYRGGAYRGYAYRGGVYGGNPSLYAYRHNFARER